MRPLGFDTSEKACRRAGLDYWPRLRPIEHDSFNAYRSRFAGARTWVFSAKATRPAWDADFRRGDHLLFGKETRGLPADVVGLYPGRLLALPMVPDERSLNLATAVCAAVYEGIRQLVCRGEARLDGRGRLIVAPDPR